MSIRNLDKMFRPRSIAVIGADLFRLRSRLEAKNLSFVSNSASPCGVPRLVCA
jgi:hypothetical protein